MKDMPEENIRETAGETEGERRAFRVGDYEVQVFFSGETTFKECLKNLSRRKRGL